ncbi:MAG TPA: DNA-formamidopyrimidine glycosylase family protein [Solirubrobacterales bacterium]|nr:DNA-formamidopyrimidine glycosylase family protein [Solirubrobacterales bacterium]
MAEGDTILRAGRRIEAALGGQELAVRAGNARGRAAGLERLDGRRLELVETHGKHLLLRFGELTLHSHLGMSGSWQVGLRGERWRKPASAAWAVLSGERSEAVQFGGPTLRVLDAGRLRRDPVLRRLGPDVLAPDFDPVEVTHRLRGDGDREVGDALLDQRLVAGIGNIFKSEACFAARVNPWQRVAELSDERLAEVLSTARRLMLESVERGRPSAGVYRHSGQPCPRCGGRIAARGQGDANRRIYWCPRCQAGESRAK